jgi:preprotein translocase subunit SecG
MNIIFAVSQIVITALLIAAILVQQRGTGLGSSFGGESQLYRSKRGVERILFGATILLSVLFAVNALVAVITG